MRFQDFLKSVLSYAAIFEEAPDWPVVKTQRIFIYVWHWEQERKIALRN